MQEDKEEYYVLTDKLEETEWAIEGKCNDIDCDKYLYKDLLKKKYEPVLKHNFSCIKKLKSGSASTHAIVQLYTPPYKSSIENEL